MNNNFDYWQIKEWLKSAEEVKKKNVKKIQLMKWTENKAMAII